MTKKQLRLIKKFEEHNFSELDRIYWYTENMSEISFSEAAEIENYFLNQIKE